MHDYPQSQAVRRGRLSPQDLVCLVRPSCICIDTQNPCAGDVAALDSLRFLGLFAADQEVPTLVQNIQSAVQRTLDLSQTGLSGAFPVWLVHSLLEAPAPVSVNLTVCCSSKLSAGGAPPAVCAACGVPRHMREMQHVQHRVCLAYLGDEPWVGDMHGSRRRGWQCHMWMARPFASANLHASDILVAIVTPAW